MILLLTIVAMLIVWGIGSFNLWGFDQYRTIILIFLGVAVLLQLAFRAKVNIR